MEAKHLKSATLYDRDSEEHVIRNNGGYHFYPLPLPYLAT